MENLDILTGVLSIAGPPVYVGGKGTYEGPYTVTPHVSNNQVLPTNDLVMSDDVTVFKIPYAEVSNISGKTVTIGG